MLRQMYVFENTCNRQSILFNNTTPVYDFVKKNQEGKDILFKINNTYLCNLYSK